jgi:hypothetical protein
MLIRQEFLELIAAGKVDRAFRNWRRPTVKAGGRLRTGVGELAIVAVDEISRDDITAADVRQAGYASRAELFEDLDSGRQGTLYRIRFRLSGPDTRIALRERDAVTVAEAAEISKRLARFDKASRYGAWTARTLELIDRLAGERASVLAAEAGFDKEWFKVQVRKLKELGLTESLHPGYRLAPRGEAYRSWLRGR